MKAEEIYKPILGLAGINLLALVIAWVWKKVMRIR